MPSPDAIYSATTPGGEEMMFDGQTPPVGNPVQLTDLADWDYIGVAPTGYWQVMTQDPTTHADPWRPLPSPI